MVAGRRVSSSDPAIRNLDDPAAPGDEPPILEMFPGPGATFFNEIAIELVYG